MGAGEPGQQQRRRRMGRRRLPLAEEKMKTANDLPAASFAEGINNDKSGPLVMRQWTSSQYR